MCPFVLDVFSFFPPTSNQRQTEQTRIALAHVFHNNKKYLEKLEGAYACWIYTIIMSHYESTLYNADGVTTTVAEVDSPAQPPIQLTSSASSLPEIENAYSEARARGLPDGWTCSIDVSDMFSSNSIWNSVFVRWKIIQS
jgi:hypothetical protein